jgi:hypothetical protein
MALLLSPSGKKPDSPGNELLRQKVAEGRCNEKAYAGKTFGRLLRERISGGQMDEEEGHLAFFKGEVALKAAQEETHISLYKKEDARKAARTPETVNEVRHGNYFVRTKEGIATGQDLLELVAVGRVAMAEALAAIKEGNAARLSQLFEEMRKGNHDLHNDRGETLEAELAGMAGLGIVDSVKAVRMIRLSYVVRARSAMSELRKGEYVPNTSGWTYGKDLTAIARTIDARGDKEAKYVDQEAVHKALWQGYQAARTKQVERAKNILSAVEAGLCLESAAPDAPNPLTLGDELKMLVADGIVDAEDAAMAFIHGKVQLLELLTANKEFILEQVAANNSLPAVYQKLALLLESGAVSQHDVNNAKFKGMLNARTAKPERDFPEEPYGV